MIFVLTTTTMTTQPITLPLAHARRVTTTEVSWLGSSSRYALMSESRKPGPDPHTPQDLPEVLSEDKPAEGGSDL